MMSRLFLMAAGLLPLAACDVPVADNSGEIGSIAYEPPAGGPLPAPAARPPVKQDFASIEEAFDVLAAATEAGQREQQAAAYNWLCRQGNGAVPQVTAAINDPQRSLEVRRLACGVVGKLGPQGVPVLIETSRSPEKRLKLKAIETMPSVEPPTREIVDRLLQLLDDADEDVQVAAIRSLGGIGPPAERSAAPLIALQNSAAPESVRDAAAAAVRKVQPRRTLNDR